MYNRCTVIKTTFNQCSMLASTQFRDPHAWKIGWLSPDLANAIDYYMLYGYRYIVK